MKRCDPCGKDFHGYDLLNKHIEEAHREDKAVPRIYPTFGWICVLPGLDHLRMNVAKSIVNTYWVAFFKSIFFNWVMKVH